MSRYLKIYLNVYYSNKFSFKFNLVQLSLIIVIINIILIYLF